VVVVVASAATGRPATEGTGLVGPESHSRGFVRSRT
jgi:hypothetical protein